MLASGRPCLGTAPDVRLLYWAAAIMNASLFNTAACLSSLILVEELCRVDII